MDYETKADAGAPARACYLHHREGTGSDNAWALAMFYQALIAFGDDRSIEHQTRAPGSCDLGDL
jgi:hypothetical protein